MTLNVGIIGVSGIAQGYVHQLRRIEGVSVAWAHSRGAGRAREFAGRMNLPRSGDDLPALLAADDVEAVVIATEPSRHIEQALLALDAGKHILLEKPVDVNLDKAEAFQDRTRDYPGVVAVVSQKRFDSILQKMKARLDDFPFSAPKGATLTMMWRRDEDYYEKGTGWRKTDSHVFLNQGIHWLDVLNWFFGEPQQIHAVSRVTRPFLSCADQTGAVISYPSAVVTLTGGTFAGASYPDQFIIYSEADRLDYQEITARGQPSRLQRRLLRRPPPADPMALQVRDFIDSIRENRAPLTTVDAAVRALRLAMTISRVDH